MVSFWCPTKNKAMARVERFVPELEGVRK